MAARGLGLSTLMDMKTSTRSGTSGALERAGFLIVNADDWGRDYENTERTRECIARGTVSSVSGMVFMEDSERAAAIAREQGIDVGLHLNFTTAFSAHSVPNRLAEHQGRLARYLRKHRLAQVVYHPGLVSSFEYVVASQRDEFCRLYGAELSRLDGHHHMHLCANVVLGKLLPAGTLVRRNFSFRPGEKSSANRLYRQAVDYQLARRHRVVDYLFSLPPLEPRSRLQGIFSLASCSMVELETHPIHPVEHDFLLGGEFLQLTASIQIAPHSAVLKSRIPMGDLIAGEKSDLRCLDS